MIIPSLTAIASMIRGFCGAGTGTAESVQASRSLEGMPPEYYGASKACQQQCRRTWKATRGNH